MESATDLFSSAAITTTIAGNIGVDPFLTMFLVGLIDHITSDEDKYIVPDDLKTYVSSYGAISVWGVLAVLEIVGKCVPVVDELIDSAEVFIVPIISVLGTLSTMGLYSGPTFDQEDRRLQEDDGEDSLDVAGSVVTTIQVIVVMLGVVLALSIHLLKMIIRIIGEGWLTQILTVVEVSFCVITVTISIYVTQFAIFMAIVFILAMFSSLYKRFKKYRENKQAPDDQKKDRKFRFPWSKERKKEIEVSQTNSDKTSSLLC